MNIWTEMSVIALGGFKSAELLRRDIDEYKSII
jgi:hypothetical protein